MKINRAIIAFFIILISGCQIQSKKGIIISKLTKASELATVEVVLVKHIYNTDDLNSFFNNLFGNDQLFLAKTEARIKLGIDLSEISSEDIEIRGVRLELNLPPVKVINFSYPIENATIDENVSVVNLDKLDKTKANTLDEIFMASELNIWNNIDKLGLHEEVEDKTRNILTTIFKQMGFTEIIVKFEDRKSFNYRSNKDGLNKIINPDDDF